MHDIIYMPFHCSNLGLHSVRFPVCYKEQLWCEIKHITNSPEKSNYRCELHVPRCGLFTVDRGNYTIPSRNLWKVLFLSLQFLQLKFLGRYLYLNLITVTTVSCIYKTGLTCQLIEHGSWMVNTTCSLEKWVIQWHIFDVPTLSPQIPCSSNSNAGQMVDIVQLRFVSVSSALVLWHDTSYMISSWGFPFCNRFIRVHQHLSVSLVSWTFNDLFLMSLF